MVRSAAAALTPETARMAARTMPGKRLTGFMGNLHGRANTR